MIINVSVPTKPKDAKELLLAQENPKYVLLKEMGIRQTFEVTDATGSLGDLSRYTKGLITKEYPGIMCSVLEDGKAYAGQK